METLRINVGEPAGCAAGLTIATLQVEDRKYFDVADGAAPR
jgi:hypothetical protein